MATLHSGENEAVTAIDRVRSGAAEFLVRGLAGAALLVAAVLSSGCCKLIPWALAVDPSLTATADGDAVLEPGETAVVRPTWKAVINTAHSPDGAFGGPKPCPAGGCVCKFPTSATGLGDAETLTGPPGGGYAIRDPQAYYGAMTGVHLGALKSCDSTNNCYAILVRQYGDRPAAHWDVSLGEGVTGGYAHTWKIHVGRSFSDVPSSHPFYGKIETLFHNGITAGCAPGAYCPEESVSRSNLAIFLARAIAQGDANVPASGTLNGYAYDCAAGGVSLYSDIAPTDDFCRHVHYIAGQNVTAGCAPFRYCPSDLLSRLEMAALIAKAMVAPSGGGGVPVAYSESGRSYSCDSANPEIHFKDVPDSDPFCKHVHYLWARGIVAGCGPEAFCADGVVARDQMAKFLVNAFQLHLYGP